MRMIKKIVLMLLLVSSLSVLYGCSKESSELESWAYIYDKATEILRLNSDGTASYELKVYEDGKQVKKKQEYSSYIKDDSFITLKDENGGELKIRYIKTDTGIDLYEKTEYTAILRKSENGIAGVWADKNNSDYFYEFTEEGTFNEDGYFTGIYSLDEKEGIINLTYDGNSSKAVLYYTILGDSVFIEYPWPMVRTEKDQGTN